MGKLLLIDGNSILNRGYYAIPLLSDKNGVYTNGVLGFLNIFTKAVDEERPDYITVAFDMHAPTFRHKMFEAYKGTRKPAPEEFIMQIPIIHEVLNSMGVRIVEKEGYEADDLLGTLAKKGEAAGLEVTLLSGDRDLLQIASDNIKIAIPKTAGGKTETHYYYTKDVVEEYGVTPLEFIDVKALQGDTSDNIPGVSKVGPKTATELIQKYKNLEGIYEHLSEITKKALHDNLENDKEQAFMSRTLATIETNAPIELVTDGASAKGFLNDNSMEVLMKYSLKSVVSKLEGLNEGDSQGALSIDRAEFTVVEDFNETEKIISRLQKVKAFGFYCFEDGVSVSFSKDETYVIKEYGFVTKDFLSGLLSETFTKINAAFTWSVKAAYDYIGDFTGALYDVELLAYILDPNRGNYPITYLAERYLNLYKGDEKEFVADKDHYYATIARDALLMSDFLVSEVKKLSMYKLFTDIEMPLSFVLYSMEKEGILVDREGLGAFSKELSVGIEKLEKRIYEAAGEEFNINSPKQLGVILFEKLNLPCYKKKKSGYSTAADVLEDLKKDYPIVADVLEYRMLSKLKSTYADGLVPFIGSDGRIHTHFNQTITATGRISSTEPNLQNIPVRTELGRELRKVFYPKAGCVFIDADYSQIELRLMAHMSGDEGLIGAFNEGEDIHRSTASKVFKTPLEEVTPAQRRNAKAVNFGIIYGISAFGLSNDIGVDMTEAKQYISDYFDTFTGVKTYIDKTVEQAKADGFTTTLYGRIRPIPELKASNFMQRSFGERVAMNAPIQGTAADIMKIAMINIFNRLRKEGLKAKLLLQVHDEVLIETPIAEVEKVKALVTEEMTKAASLKVELLSDCKVGDNWDAAH